MPITTEFWATTAQVIPALLLAVVLAERSDRPKPAEPSSAPPPPEPLRFLFSLAMLVSIALGVSAEFLALDGLLGGGGRGTARVVIIAIGGLAFWVVAVAAMRRAGRFLPELDEDDPLDDLPIGRALATAAVGMGHFLVGFAVAFLPLAAAVWLAIRV